MIYDSIVPVLVNEDTSFTRERIDHAARLLMLQRPQEAVVIVSRSPALLQTPRPSPVLFEDRFVSVYAVGEVYTLFSTPIAPQPWFVMWKPSTRLDDLGAEEQTRRFDLGLLHRYRFTVAGQVSTLSIVEEIPDLCGDEWKEWVPQPIDHARRFVPFRQYLGSRPPQPWILNNWRSANWKLEAESDFRVRDHARDLMVFRTAFAQEGPFPPVFLEAYDVQIGVVILRWSLSPGAAGYRLYINGVPQPPVITLRTTTVSALLINTRYKFNIVPVNSKGVDDGAISNSILYEQSSEQIMVVESLPGTNAGTLN